MLQRPSNDLLTYPHPVPPEAGMPIEVVPGIQWLRIPLPFQLDHVNLYLLEDHGGWTLVDTGFGNSSTQALWEELLAGPLRGRVLTRMIATHHHPDHVGMAGWLSQRFNIPVTMTAVEFNAAGALQADPTAFDTPEHRHFYLSHGLDEPMAALISGRGHMYLSATTGLSEQGDLVADGDWLRIGGRSFQVVTGGGHSPDQIMLAAPAEGIFLAADQVLARISPNVSVSADKPDIDVLGDYVASLGRLRSIVPDDLLVLPGHERPFFGLHVRIDQLRRHHAVRCDRIAAVCTTAPRSAAELVPLLFNRPLDPHQTGFAFGEVLAHINYMVNRGELRREIEADAIHRVRAV
ncbi:MAG: MBL fold metallo-hydrolase [Alphaproteobacteria bacterium]|nr:MBL fold metallo-hydrolase [Alphaproteobacteria bacterium]